MMQMIMAHKDQILMAALTISELMALLLPNAGGILKGIIEGLKSLGAKDIAGK